MTNSFRPQKQPSSPSGLIFSAKTYKSHGGVIQDKSAASGERLASGQPARLQTEQQVVSENRQLFRTQSEHTHKEGYVPLTIYVPCSARDEIERRAVNNGKKEVDSLSYVARPIFLKGLQVDIDMQYASIIKPVVKESIQEEMRSLRKFVALCFARIGFDTGQTRALTTNILARQPGMTQEACSNILDKSAESARRNLTRHTPQIADLLEVFDRWMAREEVVQTPTRS